MEAKQSSNVRREKLVRGRFFGGRACKRQGLVPIRVQVLFCRSFSPVRNILNNAMHTMMSTPYFFPPCWDWQIECTSSRGMTDHLLHSSSRDFFPLLQTFLPALLGPRRVVFELAWSRPVRGIWAAPRGCSQ